MSQKIESILICLSFFGQVIIFHPRLVWLGENLFIVRLALEFFFSIIIINYRSVTDLFVWINLEQFFSFQGPNDCESTDELITQIEFT